VSICTGVAAVSNFNISTTDATGVIVTVAVAVSVGGVPVTTNVKAEGGFLS